LIETVILKWSNSGNLTQSRLGKVLETLKCAPVESTPEIKNFYLSFATNGTYHEKHFIWMSVLLAGGTIREKADIWFDNIDEDFNRVLTYELVKGFVDFISKFAC
jgi:hypothetical protein